MSNRVYTYFLNTLITPKSKWTLLSRSVVRSNDNNLEIEKSWELMSEFDKAELIRKKIIHEL